VRIEEHRAQLGDRTVFWREAGGAPVLYVHGVPTSSDDWLPFLERTGGFAPDLPGFGRSGKPADGDYSMEGLARAVGDFADHVGLEKVRLVVHDWGALALRWATGAPDRIERLVVINAVPLLPGYRWHRIARLWRTPVVGELFMGLSTRRGFRLLSREANPAGGPLPDEFIDAFWPHFDQGTQRAILRLYRSAPAEALAAAGADLGRLDCPALVAWGGRDPYIPRSFGAAYAERLPGADLLELPDAGHWPWLDRPDLVQIVTDFLVR
jgi:pimeloyl-ACP methyl ester carboxylesterase